MKTSKISFCFILITFYSFLFLPANLYAQRYNKYAKKPPQNAPKTAKDFFKNEDYPDATKLYIKLIKKHPKNPEYNYNLAICYLNSNDNKAKAIPYLEFTVKQSKFDNEAWFYLGQAYHYANRFDDAIKAYKKYKLQAKGKDIEKADMEINMCNNGKLLVKFPVDVTFQNVGKVINTKYPDYYPLITGDETYMVFTSRRPRYRSSKPEDDGYFSSDIYYSRCIRGVWQKPRKVSALIDSPFDEEAVGLTPNGQDMVIYVDHIEEYGDIYNVLRHGRAWLRPDGMNDNINGGFESSGSVSPDGNEIYFASDRPGGYGETDIYVSKKLPNGQWAIPTNLGPQINTAYKEDFPHLSPDSKTLYFSSQGHTSMGDFDIFKSEWDSINDKWKAPTNLGYPINTSGDDRSISFTNDHRVAYISSVRPGGYGDYDIYRVVFNNKGKRYSVVKGYIFNGDSIKITNADASITATNNKTSEQLTFTPEPSTGRFIMALAPGKYDIDVEVDGYKPLSDKIIIYDKGSFKPEINKNYHLTKDAKP